MLHALKYLHALDVWHRDLKSSNVMTLRVGAERRVKVGLAFEIKISEFEIELEIETDIIIEN